MPSDSLPVEIPEAHVNQSVAEINQAAASQLSNNLPRLLREFSRDFERRIARGLSARGHPDIRPAHSVVFAVKPPEGTKTANFRPSRALPARKQGAIRRLH